MHAGRAAPAARESPEAKRWRDWHLKVWPACTEMERPKETRVRHQQPLLCMCNRHTQHNTSNTDLPHPKPVPSTVFPVSVNGNSILAVIQNKNLDYLTLLFYTPLSICQQILLSLLLNTARIQPLLSLSLLPSWSKPPFSLAWIIPIGS